MEWLSMHYAAAQQVCLRATELRLDCMHVHAVV